MLRCSARTIARGPLLATIAAVRDNAHLMAPEVSLWLLA